MTSRQPSRARQAARAAATVTLVVLAVFAMVCLSLWQWGRARQTGAFLNYSYAGEWLLFAVLTVGGAIRLAHEGRVPIRPRARADRSANPDLAPPPRVEGPALRPMVGPPLAPGEELEELTYVRLRRRLGLDRQTTDRQV